MKLFKFLLVAGGLFLFSCNQNSPKIDVETYARFQQKGVEISNLSQATLLANVGKAIQNGGPEYAVEFCNLKAAAIIDSLNVVNSCVISRVTDKTRNPENGLNSGAEKALWNWFQNNMSGDTLIQEQNNLVYYKPISIALPACLKCHGNPDSEINTATLQKLQKLYPNDLAKGYKMEDFRGLWKIEFQN